MSECNFLIEKVLDDLQMAGRKKVKKGKSIFEKQASKLF
jgi:hypothetical protein